MKQFAIQAICDEKHLWGIMQMLESNRCLGISARPFPNGEAKPVAKSNGVARLKGSHFDITLQIMREHGKPILAKELRMIMKTKGYPVSTASNVLYVLKKRGLIKQLGHAKYGVTKKGAVQ